MKDKKQREKGKRKESFVRILSYNHIFLGLLFEGLLVHTHLDFGFDEKFLFSSGTNENESEEITKLTYFFVSSFSA